MKITIEIKGGSHAEALAVVDSPGFVLNPNKVPPVLRDDVQVIHEAVRKLLSAMPARGYDVEVTGVCEVDENGENSGIVSWKISKHVAKLEPPAEDSVEIPAETPGETPAETPTEAPLEPPAEETPVTDPAANTLTSGDV
jgi:hypothetical protein